MKNNKFYQNKKVFVTGHTGFKGSWLSKLLLELGAEVCGYALEPGDDQPLFKLSEVNNLIDNIYGDIRNLNFLKESMMKFKPEIVIHMAAQPLVRESYADPVETYSTNVMGTVNILEAIRSCGSVQSVVNVTTDKVYKNIETTNGYKEEDVLDGYDPYSNSKSCSELVTHSYIKAFLQEKGIAVSTCRAGNVIGGGDFSKDRIIPDCYRAAIEEKAVVLRNPRSVRPYQHVLDPLCAYLLIAHNQYEDSSYADAYNIGPDAGDNVETAGLVKRFCDTWGKGMSYTVEEDENAPHEANLLYLDCNKVKKTLDWNPVWGIAQAVTKTAEWYQEYADGNNMRTCMERQITDFLASGGKV